VASEKALKFKVQFKEKLLNTFSLRGHMSLILLCTGLSGVFSSQILHYFHLHSMRIRYPLAVLIAYGVFFLLLKIWLKYIFPALNEEEKSKTIKNRTVRNVVDSIPDINISTGPSSVGDVDQYIGKGGQFAGAGASDSWVEAADSDNGKLAASAFISNDSSSSSSSSSSGGFSLDLGKDAEGLIVIVLGAMLIAAVFGSAFYLIYQSPEILTETAFQFLLSGSLLKKSKAAINGDWSGTVFKKTWGYFALVMFLSFMFATAASTNYPQATNLKEVMESYRYSK
jgi:hypothetical protein